MISFLRDVAALAKLRITMVAMFTGYAAIAVHGTYALDVLFIAPCLLALVLLGLTANTLNQLFERDIDAIMSRTRHRRPIPAGRISPLMAAMIALTSFVGCAAILYFFYHSWLAVLMAAFTVAYYSFFYTLWLKRRHWSNIVIGGVPGAMGPVVAWAAVANELAWAPVAMATLIFLWTPPHVWALAIRLKEDYARAGVPMLPVVKGIDETTRQIFVYTVITVIGSLLLPLVVQVAEDGQAYLILAVVLGAIFLVWTYRLWKTRPVGPTMPLFRFTILYIGLLFVGLIIDGLAARS